MGTAAQKPGFSLKEFLVVIVIIDILGSVGTLGYLTYISQSRVGATKDNFEFLKRPDVNAASFRATIGSTTSGKFFSLVSFIIYIMRQIGLTHLFSFPFVVHKDQTAFKRFLGGV